MTALSPSDLQAIAITDVMDVVASAVRTISARLPAHVDRDDLTAAGHLALVRAFERAPHSEGEGAVRAFLLRRVAGAIRDELRRADAVGRHTRHILRVVAGSTASLEAQLGRAPTVLEVAALSGLTTAQVRGAHLRAESATRVSDSDAAMTLVAAGERSPLESVEWDERLAAVRALLDVLTPGERVAVSRTVFDGLTLEDVALELGVTTGRVHQLRSNGLKRLRAQPATLQLREFAA